MDDVVAGDGVDTREIEAGADEGRRGVGRDRAVLDGSGRLVHAGGAVHRLVAGDQAVAERAAPDLHAAAGVASGWIADAVADDRALAHRAAGQVDPAAGDGGVVAAVVRDQAVVRNAGGHPDATAGVGTAGDVVRNDRILERAAGHVDAPGLAGRAVVAAVGTVAVDFAVGYGSAAEVHAAAQVIAVAVADHAVGNDARDDAQRAATLVAIDVGVPLPLLQGEAGDERLRMVDQHDAVVRGRAAGIPALQDRGGGAVLAAYCHRFGDPCPHAGAWVGSVHDNHFAGLLVGRASRVDRVLQAVRALGGRVVRESVGSAGVHIDHGGQERNHVLAQRLATVTRAVRDDQAYRIRGWRGHGERHFAADVVHVAVVVEIPHEGETDGIGAVGETVQDNVGRLGKPLRGNRETASQIPGTGDTLIRPHVEAGALRPNDAAQVVGNANEVGAGVDRGGTGTQREVEGGGIHE